MNIFLKKFAIWGPALPLELACCGGLNFEPPNWAWLVKLFAELGLNRLVSDLTSSWQLHELGTSPQTEIRNPARPACFFSWIIITYYCYIKEYVLCV